jgi:hypothetical protein
MIIAKELWYELVPLLHFLLVRLILVLQLFVRACAWNTTAIQPHTAPHGLSPTTAAAHEMRRSRKETVVPRAHDRSAAGAGAPSRVAGTTCPASHRGALRAVQQHVLQAHVSDMLHHASPPTSTHAREYRLPRPTAHRR